METIDGSAVEGEDYEPVNEILTFQPHEREKEVGKKETLVNKGIRAFTACLCFVTMILFLY